jgi:hypothetical protein
VPRFRLPLVPLLALLAIARVLWVVLLDQRPHWGNAEGSDLERMALYDQGLRGLREWSFWGQIWRDGFKPPLWFGGVPLLLSPMASLRWPAVGALQALCLGVAVLGVARSAMSAGLAGPAASGDGRSVPSSLGRAAGVAAALLLCAWPGAAGTASQAGVEPLFAALLAWLPHLLARAIDGGSSRLAAAGPGLVLAVGLLSKWNFVAYAVPALAVALLVAPKAQRPPLAVAAMLGTIPFALWLLGPADLPLLLRGAGDEPTFSPPHGREALLWLPRALGAHLGPWGWPAAVLAVLGVRRSPFAAATLLSLLALHEALPHKDTRYLLPALPPLAILAGHGLSTLRPPVRALLLAAAAMGLLDRGDPPGTAYDSASVLLRPRLDDAGAGAIFDAPTLRMWARPMVTAALRDDPGRAPLRTMVRWELHARGPRAVAMRDDHDDLCSRAAAFDLERSTHVLTNRPLRADEEAALRSLGYQPLAPAVLRVPEPPGGDRFVLWERAPAPRVERLPPCAAGEPAPAEIGVLRVRPWRSEGVSLDIAERTLAGASRTLARVGLRLERGLWQEVPLPSALAKGESPATPLARLLPEDGPTITLVAARLAPGDHGLGPDLVGISAPAGGLPASGLLSPAASAPLRHAAFAAVGAPGPGALGAAEAGAVLAHELLHTVGLPHREEPGALMQHGRPGCLGTLDPVERALVWSALPPEDRSPGEAAQEPPSAPRPDPLPGGTGPG